MVHDRCDLRDRVQFVRGFDVRRARPEDPTYMKTEDELQQVLDVESVDETALPVGMEPVARSNWQLFRRRFFAHKMAVVSLILLAILIVACFTAGWWAPYSKDHIDPNLVF